MGQHFALGLFFFFKLLFKFQLTCLVTLVLGRQRTVFSRKPYAASLGYGQCSSEDEKTCPCEEAETGKLVPIGEFSPHSLFASVTFHC